ncbi:urease accessory protein UreE [Roseomonas marmotae]|uniref:Urease accessory protein UreE n=1 Tax=Roseomonas marmotae TaxID=2768161 RepID=A0ABS3KG66_9PROT|nr:urease accessory protein UreE [Roseomonas marmotae]MBO1075633.1 urease accessory protein UreE [Roseomonas marmotae]QTI79494.1 urease accessory protein UreE [Roseomonas marmotae]
MAEATLPRATQVLHAGHWQARTAKDVITVDFDDRHRRRRRYTAEKGLSFLLDLPEAVALRDGDGLLLEGGGVVLVRAAPEPLIEVRGQGTEHLLRLAWHLGNRHLPAEIGPDRILIREDHVILRMLQGLGATTARVEAPFNPEGGAYGEHNRHTGHQHGELHDHGDGHFHSH